MSVQLKDMDDYQKKIVANVSHDFRSPLTSIKGYVQAMTDGTIPPELHEKYLNIILFEVERLTDLTTDLLTLNEFDTKELLYTKPPLYNSGSDQEIQPSLSRESAHRSTFPFSCCCFLMRFLSVQIKRKIQQVLYNLIE